MEHKEAIEMMASERYLLDELTPELRDAYEDHMFGCQECAADAVLGANFVDHARRILPALETAGARAATRREETKAAPKKAEWFAWLRPAILRPVILVPVFASLIAVIGYQNLVTVPALETAANGPRILPAATVLQGATRGGAAMVEADPVRGSAITVPLPQSSGYAAYKFNLYNAADKMIWTVTVAAAESVDGTASLWLPGTVKPGRYKLAISGKMSGKTSGTVSETRAAGESIPIEEQFFDLAIRK